ncbi:hypothetical protein QNH20_15560 [Neobacillus sp. WH10]|uniref:hypothetical protein n=1 Tax=Neobacillus sp. WH10 TaxID=3047873 RepID=UPI0024C1AE8A|nr:hypothetical protein [Neobacillus sp. WH10]WHY75546.1 hypothetical protein QNH20_15560 [Neobacillus sp. WH10]
MNKVGKYASSPEVDALELMSMVFELTEKDKMVMWSEGYIDHVINKLPVYARDILENRKERWEDTKAFYEKKLNEIINDADFINKLKGERKEFALFVMKHYPELSSLLFLIFDGNLKDDDLRKFVYRRRFTSRKKYLH